MYIELKMPRKSEVFKFFVAFMPSGVFLEFFRTDDVRKNSKKAFEAISATSPNCTLLSDFWTLCNVYYTTTSDLSRIFHVGIFVIDHEFEIHWTRSVKVRTRGRIGPLLCITRRWIGESWTSAWPPTCQPTRSQSSLGCFLYFEKSKQKKVLLYYYSILIFFLLSFSSGTIRHRQIENAFLCTTSHSHVTMCFP